MEFLAGIMGFEVLGYAVVNGGEKPWRLAGSGGRLNRAAPKCSVVDFVSRRKAVIMAGFWVKDLEGDK